MVAVSRSSHFHSFTVYCCEFQALGRILKTAFYARAEPAWQFTRVSEPSAFKIDLVVGGLSPRSAESFAAQVQRLPAVTKVMWAESPQPVSGFFDHQDRPPAFAACAASAREADARV